MTYRHYKYKNGTTINKDQQRGSAYSCHKVQYACCYITYNNLELYLTGQVQMSNSYEVGAISETRCPALNTTISPS